jgi:pimeloyl-ACP methyl ester carboxylesterase
MLDSGPGLYCLVHGSTQNATGWNRLVPELEKFGHEAVRMNLPDNEPDAGATRYAEVIADCIPPHRSDAIVVAHSASGLFLPFVLNYREVGRLVFLAAVVPKPGVSLLDQLRAEPDMLNPKWLGKDPTKDPQIARRFLFHDCPPEVTEWALTTLRLTYARGAMSEIYPGPGWPDVPMSYIVCADDRTVQPGWSRRIARERLGVEAVELPGGHCPHVSRPGELARVLDQLGRGGGGLGSRI